MFRHGSSVTFAVQRKETAPSFLLAGIDPKHAGLPRLNELSKERNGVGETLVDKSQLVTAGRAPKQGVPTAQLFFDTDHRDRQILGRMGHNALANNWMAAFIKREDISVQGEQAHGLSGSSSTCRR
jgi:hypothetical protein